MVARLFHHFVVDHDKTVKIATFLPLRSCQITILNIILEYQLVGLRSTNACHNIVFCFGFVWFCMSEVKLLN